MARERYSAKSFNSIKLPAVFGAIRALHPEGTITVSVVGDSKQGDDGLRLLRSERLELPLVISVADSNGGLTVELSTIWDLLDVDVSARGEEAQARIHEVVRGTLGLLRPTKDEEESFATLYMINQRILKLRQLVEELPAKIVRSARSENLRCFVSFRFDEHSKALALELRNFMELARLEFISGLGYEPRSVSEKVLDRLQGKLDLFIVIFATGGDSSWLHQEIGVAKGRGLPVMVLREDGSQFDEGLLSDIEYASFPKGQISGVFIPVLQAVQYIRLKAEAH